VKPSIGRVVHYTNYTHQRIGGVFEKNPVIHAAIITAVRHITEGHDESDYLVDLHIFYARAADTKKSDVAFTRAEAGTKDAVEAWTWPTRVE
jgi:hypothetical protein